MKRLLGLAFAIVLSSAANATAQPMSSKMSVADTVQGKFTGIWEGTFTSDHTGPGGMRLEFIHDSTWSVAMNIVADHPIESTAKAIRFDGNRAAWQQDIMGMSCRTTSSLDAGLLKGQIDCGEAKVTFELRKRP